MPLDDDRVMVATAGLFAPTIRHHRGTFYIVCTNTLHGKENFETENFLISTTDIWASKWTDPIYFPFTGIDPSLFFDDDGRTYVQGSWLIDRMNQPSCTIKQLEIDLQTGKPLSEPREIWTGHARHDTEGPHIYKCGEWYYLLVAEGGTFENHMLSIARSKNVWGKYESFTDNPLMTADGTNEYIQNIGHGELFQDESGSWWAIVLGVRNESGYPTLGRESFLTPVEWPVDGWPTISQPKMTFSHHTPDRRATNPPEHPFPLNERAFIREAGPNRGLLSQSPADAVVLISSPNPLSSQEGVIAFYGERQRTLDTTVTVLLETCSRTRSTIAGLALYFDAFRHISLAYDFELNHVEFDVHVANKSAPAKKLLPICTSPKALELKIDATSKTYRGSFRIHAGNEDRGPVCDNVGAWQFVGEVSTTELAARDFTGPLIGVFATTKVADIPAQQCVFRDFVIRRAPLPPVNEQVARL